MDSYDIYHCVYHVYLFLHVFTISAPHEAVQNLAKAQRWVPWSSRDTRQWFASMQMWCQEMRHEVQRELSQLTMHHQALQHGPPNRRSKTNLSNLVPTNKTIRFTTSMLEKHVQCAGSIARKNVCHVMPCAKNKKLNMLKDLEEIWSDLKRFEAFKILD